MIYIVDPNETERQNLVTYLKLSEIEATEFGTGEELINELYEKLPDLVIIEADLPDMDGFLLGKELCKKNIPFMFVTNRDGESNRIFGYEIGADEYIAKPYSMKETILRVGKVLRLLSVKTVLPERDEFKFEENVFIIEKRSHLCEVNGKQIHFTIAEWKIIQYLTENFQVAVSRDKLLNECLEFHFNGYKRTIDTHIKKIRSKLENPGWIETVRGHGYRFVGKKV